MRTCPKCFDVNIAIATACKHCGLPFDLTAANFARNCPAGRHVMDPTWMVCAFCKAEGLVTDDMGDPTAIVYERTSPSPRKTLFERDGATDPVMPAAGGTAMEPWARTDGPGNNFGSQQSHAKTQFESYPPAQNPAPAGGTASEADRANLRKTVLDDSPPIPLREGTPTTDASKPVLPAGGTVFPDAGTPPPSKPGFSVSTPPQVASGNQRRIVGILITYTWRPEGQIFPVRVGRNWIGRDPKLADIVIEQDETLSAVNSTISFRSKFIIGDKDSMGGTYVNGQPVEELSHPLPNYSKIRTGSTTWTFIAIDPSAQEPAD